MEGKRIPTIVVVLLTIVGTCLVGFGVWYGVNYFKNGDKPNVPDTPVEEPTSSINSLAEDLTIFNSKSTALELDMVPSKDVIYTNFENIKKM